MSTIVDRLAVLVGAIVAAGPVGTNLGLFWRLWARISGRFLRSRGAVCPALAAGGRPADAVRRAAAALAYGRWAMPPLVRAWQQVVQQAGRWRAHRYDGFRPGACALVGFCRRPRSGGGGKPAQSGADTALPAIVWAVGAAVGAVGTVRLPRRRLVRRAAPRDCGAAARQRRALRQAGAAVHSDAVRVVDAGGGVADLLPEGVARGVARVARNFPARGHVLPADKGRGRRPRSGARGRPWPRPPPGQTMAATPPPTTAPWGVAGRVVRAKVWDNLVLATAKPGAATLRCVGLHAPRDHAPRVVATPLPMSASALGGLSRDRWPIAPVPLAATQRLGAPRAVGVGGARRPRLPALGRLAGPGLTEVAATTAALATGFWERRCRPTCGRLRRGRLRVDGAAVPVPAGPRRHTASVPAPGPKGVPGHRRRSAVRTLPAHRLRRRQVAGLSGHSRSRAMRQVVQEGRVPACERGERDGCLRGGALLPTPRAEADPCAGHGAPGRLGCRACLALRRRRDLGPAGRPGGCRRPLDTRVSQERWPREAPGDPGLLAAACRDRREARLFLACGGGGKAVPWCAEGDEEAGSTHGPRPWHGVTHRAGGMVRRAVGQGVVAVGHGLQGDPELGDEGVHEEAIGGDDACSGGQRSGALDGLEAGGDAVGRAHVVGTEEAVHRGTACAWHGCAGGPAAEDVAKAHGSVRGKPLQDLREGVCAGTGQAGGQTDGVADQATAVRDTWRQGAPGGTVGAAWGERVAVCEADRDRACGIRRVLCGPARGTRCAVPGHGERRDGQAHEALRVAQRGHAGSFRACQTHRDGLSVAARAEGLDPGVHRCRAMCQAQKRPGCSASGLEADLVVRRSPVEANTGRTCFGCLWLHGCSPRVWSSGAKGQACLRSAKA